MTQFLPPNLLALFAPRDAIPYLPPAAKLPHEKVGPNYRGYSGVSQFMADFEVSATNWLLKSKFLRNSNNQLSD